MRRLPSLAVACVVLLAGCAGVNLGPVNEAGFAGRAQAEILQSSEKVLATYPAAWAKDDYGFQKASPYGTIFQGVLVLGEKHLAFSTWNEEKRAYARLIHIPYSAITRINLEKFGLGRALLIHAGEPFYTLHVLRPESGMDDPDKIQEAYDLISARSNKK